jgi:methionine-rich copper-binding protein CopC
MFNNPKLIWPVALVIALPAVIITFIALNNNQATSLPALAYVVKFQPEKNKVVKATTTVEIETSCCLDPDKLILKACYVDEKNAEIEIPFKYSLSVNKRTIYISRLNYWPQGRTMRVKLEDYSGLLGECPDSLLEKKPFIVEFRTPTSPQITTDIPNGSQGISIDVGKITYTSDKPLKDMIMMSPVPLGAPQWSPDKKQVTFTFGQLSYGTDYTITWTALADDGSWTDGVNSFTTESLVITSSSSGSSSTSSSNSGYSGTVPSRTRYPPMPSSPPPQPVIIEDTTP